MEAKKRKTINLMEDFFSPQNIFSFQDLTKKIEQLIPKSIDVFRDILDNEEIGLDYKFKVAKYILDLSPISKEFSQPKTSHTVTALIENFSPQEIADLKRNADCILEEWEKNQQPTIKKTE